MENATKYRIHSIDILRGIVMVIMALDHTRDFFHKTAMTEDPLNYATTTVPLYFTRWITHFCAPTFVFLSGVSAYLSSKNKTPGEAGKFLVKRGLWLIVVELVIITLALTFNPIYSVIILQVIWAIGCSMVLLGLLSKLKMYTLFAIGLLLFFGHDMLDYITLPQTGFTGILMKFLFTGRGTFLPLSGSHFIAIFYAILPWTGVMFLGYCAGTLFTPAYASATRKITLFYTGVLLIILFTGLRYFNIYGDPIPWDKIHFLSFLNADKYPASLLYCCMTLGPALIVLSLLENVQNWWTKIFIVYGRVPFFYYVLHFYILHTLLVIVFFATGNGVAKIVDPAVPFLFRPGSFGFGLGIVYTIWLCVVAVLYQPCRWFYKYKMGHSQWWLKYL